MKDIKPIWTVNKCVKVCGEVTHTHEVAYERLFDALTFIGAWSNMKIMQGYIVSIEPTDESCMNEVMFVAEKEETNTKEYMELEKVDLHIVNENEDEA